MASIREKQTSTGQRRFVVLFRQGGKQTSVTFTRSRDAQKACDLINALGPSEALQRIYGNTATGEMPTVAEWMERHIADLTGVTDRTRQDYRRLTARHITPHLGPLDVDEVTPADISRWANHLEDAGLSGKTIANLRGLLSAAMGYAVDEKLRGDNPTRRLRRSRSREHEREEMVFLTPQEFTRLRALMPERWWPFVTFLALTGVRWGEAVVLTVGDVDLLAPTPVVRVTKALKRIPGGFEVGPPKTRRSRRTISLPDDLVNLLAPLVMRDRDELLFAGRDGGRVHHGNFYGRVWAPAVKQFAAESGKRPRIHDLRHSHVSWCIAQGRHLEEIRDRLGHESISTTSDVYGHLQPDQQRQVAVALNGLLSEV